MSDPTPVVVRVKRDAVHRTVSVPASVPTQPLWPENPRRYRVIVNNAQNSVTVYVAVGNFWPGVAAADPIVLGGAADYFATGPVWLQSASGTLDVRITEEELE